MSNPIFNNQTHPGYSPGKSPKPTKGSGGAPAFKEKPGFNTGVPGKTQSGNRSGGVKKCPTHPKSIGI